jgi:hypothetical protein
MKMANGTLMPLLTMATPATKPQAAIPIAGGDGLHCAFANHRSLRDTEEGGMRRSMEPRHSRCSVSVGRSRSSPALCPRELQARPGVGRRVGQRNGPEAGDEAMASGPTQVGGSARYHSVS